MKRKDVIVGGLSGLAVMSKPAAAWAQGPRADLTPPKRGPITVAVVVGNGATVIDFAGPWEVFQDAIVANPGKPNDQQAAFEIAMISDKAAPLEATGGMIIQPRFNYEQRLRAPT
ncbi:MAG: hypothetical protein DLM53_06355 [Candidatus Eremiobacter antarcticus]|nr:hypothetical protein [Candidatus Eremiobacteraeota bacterium]MBC5807129.1 hypothetical protein [Candidatus Eremiobacteraeota bacterium]PZR62434.1 MAG: hypothetical protein DLM53_06355 [Candidatus Eremiobacter sp. RRmetagenome_bin22]